MSSNFFPLLRSDAVSKNCYHLDLFHLENSSEKAPVITFVAEGNKQIVSPEDIGISGSELVKSSFRNLQEIELSIEQQKDKDIISIEDQVFASEKILDKNFLIKAAQQLQSKRIKVAVPVRNSILICSADSEQGIQQLNQELHKRYHDFSKEAISRLIFDIEDGVILSAASIELKQGEFQMTEAALGSFKSNIIESKLFGDLYNVKLIVEVETMEDFQNGLFYTIPNLVKQHVNRPHFNNTIEVQATGDRPEKSVINQKKVKALFDKLKEHNTIRLHLKNATNPIKISFIFSEDFRSGAVHEKIITFL